MECVQTDNGFEFTNRFSNSKRDFPTLFETIASQLGIRHKLIRPYTPRHNGKVERSHREDQKRFYSCHSFYSLDDFTRQLAVHNRRSNNLPMRPLNYCTPSQFAVQYVLTNLHTEVMRAFKPVSFGRECVPGFLVGLEKKNGLSMIVMLI